MVIPGSRQERPVALLLQPGMEAMRMVAPFGSTISVGDSSECSVEAADEKSRYSVLGFPLFVPLGGESSLLELQPQMAARLVLCDVDARESCVSERGCGREELWELSVIV